ncbi:4Fe-4S dicluster domain-containing protein [Maledivibacter halophilus]|uniref:2-oxoglutarate ferredoxin oxidoreductase subunit delta n=1 Tax=Maledivibacter halophilus TaxID=36842 RepID=A0A1T5K0V9_9FIRM|nr:ferredoxin family protein [Maledivibacter halophilus]SKC57145.1 2-oxoglutarate ferredoxin oxidoreductase subunit delta [Maledivibacter halophilus]
MKKITIDPRLCKKCGICVEFCPADVYTRELDGSPVISFQEKCTGCKLCELRCPDFAIKVEVSKNDIK